MEGQDQVRETEKRGLSFRTPLAGWRVRNLHLNFQFTIRELRFTIHEKDQIPHPQEARIRDDRARAKG